MPTKTIHDISTGKVIEREMNADELAQWEKDKTEAIAKAQAEAESLANKAALLAKLGITEEEARLLLA